MRIQALLFYVFATLATNCRSHDNRSQLAALAQDFLRAASVGDSARLKLLAVDSLVMRDLAVLNGEAPAILQEAAMGLDVRRGGDVWTDSAYLFLQPRTTRTGRGIDVGFVRRDSTWLISYVGLTGSDLRGAAKTP